MTGFVVYIDDEAVLCRATRMVFELLEPPIAFETFADPALAIDFIRAHDVAIVICDYRMPKLSGLDVLARIDRQVPFYLLSGDLDVSRWADTNPRVTGVLAKPCRPERLIEVIRSHLGE